MRIAVTLEAETERLLRRAMAERGLSFKAAVNEAIRRGLADLAGPVEDRFVVRSSPMGRGRGIDPARLNCLADDLEADEYMSLARGQANS